MTLQNSLGNIHLVDVAVIMAWVILLLPALVYLKTTWEYRRDLLFSKLGPAALELYYKQFFPYLIVDDSSEDQGKKKNKISRKDLITKRFRKHFAQLYGRRHYVVPLVLLATLAGLGLRATSQSVKVWLGQAGGGSEYPPIVISAFLGAYAWVLYDHFQRFRTGDFTSHDIYAALYRFLIAIPLGISLSAVLKNEVGVALAFLLAAFPTTALITLMRRLASQKLGIGESGESGILELEKLQSVGRAKAERFLDEGISNIAELAWADPIALTIETNLEFNFVIDSVSQALLWVYFEDGVKKLYPLSLRGAQEVCALFTSLDSEEQKERAAAEQNLDTGAALMGIDRESFLFTLISVRDDPYTQFLYAIWE
jgi:hypothetical protein